MSEERTRRSDFEAAMHEIDSNLSVRRLVFVIANVLVPASFVALITRRLNANRNPYGASHEGSP